MGKEEEGIINLGYDARHALSLTPPGMVNHPQAVVVRGCCCTKVRAGFRVDCRPAWCWFCTYAPAGSTPCSCPDAGCSAPAVLGPVNAGEAESGHRDRSGGVGGSRLRQEGETLKA
jgi:hypothetical protein